MKNFEKFFTEIKKCTGLANIFELSSGFFLFTKKPFGEYSHQVPLKIALYQIIRELLQAKRKSLLCFGYRLNPSNEYGVECFHPNACTIRLLQSCSLQNLFINPSLLIEGVLLLVTSEHSLMQIWGPPISELIYGFHISTQKRKETITRLPMLYQRPRLNKNGQVLFHLKIDESLYQNLADLISKEDLLAVEKKVEKLRLANLLDYYCPRLTGPQFECEFTLPDKFSNLNKVVRVEFTQNQQPQKYDCEYLKIARFLFQVFKRVFGHIIFSNHKEWKKRFYSYVALRRNERLPFNLNGISSHSVKFNSKGTTRTASIKCQTNLVSFYRLVFQKFVPSIVKTVFYVTESSHRKQRLFYYRHDDWLAVTKEPKTKLLSRMLELIGRKKKRTKGRKSITIVPNCRLRLVPKKAAGDFRPIMNMKITNAESSMKYTLAILNFYRKQYPKLLGSSVMGFDRVKYKIDTFANSPGNLGNPDTYKMVKFDLKSCYDNIPHEKMIEVLHEVIIHDEFSIQKLEKVRLINGKLFKKIEYIAVPTNHMQSENASHIGSLTINDRNQPQRISKQTVLDILKLHITQNIVLFEGRLWRQKCGIPQGSILSGILCSIFYGHMDRKCYREFLKSSEILILRFIDDILIVSKNDALITEYLGQGVDTRYGFSINTDKTAFQYGDESNIEEFFAWCGMFISNKDLSIRANFNEEGLSLYDSFTIDYSLPPLEILTKQLSSFTRHKLSPIFINKRFEKSNLEYNIQGNIEITRKRLIALQRELKLHAGFKIRPQVIQKIMADIELNIKGKAKARLLR
jgi:hypothetical protein